MTTALKQRYRKPANIETEVVTTDIESLQDYNTYEMLTPSRIPARRTRPPEPITNGPVNRYKQRSTGSPTGPKQNFRPSNYTAEYGEEEAYKGQPQQTTRFPQNQQRKSKNKGSLSWVLFTIGIILFVLALYTIITAYISPWYAATFSDPSKFGPLQGTKVQGVFGGGDSPTQPSTVFGVNINGKISIIKIIDSKHSMIIPGPNLEDHNIPDYTHTKLELKTGDFDHDGKQDVEVILYYSSFTSPITRSGDTFILYGDGRGNLAARQ